MAPPRKSVLPKPLPDGFVLTDSEKKKWRLGKIIGQGGFGLIYLGTVMSTLCLTHLHTCTLCHITYVRKYEHAGRLVEEHPLFLCQKHRDTYMSQGDTTLISFS